MAAPSETRMNIVLQAEAPRVEIVDADSDHAFAMAPKLRAADVEEIAALTEVPPLPTLMESMRGSLRSYTVLVDGDPTIMFGVAVHPDDAECGVPWLLATDGLRRIRREVLRFGPPVADKAFEGFKRLCNITSGSNTVAHRWLAGLGFELGPLMPGAGRNGEDLLFFSKETPSCATPPL